MEVSKVEMQGKPVMHAASIIAKWSADMSRSTIHSMQHALNLTKPGKRHVPISSCPRTALGASSTQICCGNRGKHPHEGTAWTANTAKTGIQDVAGQSLCVHGRCCWLTRSNRNSLLAAGQLLAHAWTQSTATVLMHLL
jgi:hypothetical protein